VKSIHITDVTLRDGLQVETVLPSVEQKLTIFERLLACGYNRLEIASFVHPKWMPRFKDSELFCETLFKRGRPEIETMAFVPNLKGLERLLRFPIEWVSTFVAVSEQFNKKNVNRSIDETLVEIRKIVEKAHHEKLKVRVYVSTVFGCPYQGRISSDELARVLSSVGSMDPDEIALSDTTGVGTPLQVEALLNEGLNDFPTDRIAMHLHDTYGLAIANVAAALQAGVFRFDGATGGIGGCPYAKGATGNVGSDDLMYFFYRCGRIAEFRADAFCDAVKTMSDLNLRIRSHLGEVLGKGGTIYGV